MSMINFAWLRVHSKFFSSTRFKHRPTCLSNADKSPLMYTWLNWLLYFIVESPVILLKGFVGLISTPTWCPIFLRWCKTVRRHRAKAIFCLLAQCCFIFFYRLSFVILPPTFRWVQRANELKQGTVLYSGIQSLRLYIRCSMPAWLHCIVKTVGNPLNKFQEINSDNEEPKQTVLQLLTCQS